MVQSKRKSQVRMRIEVNQNISRDRKIFGANTSEDVAENIVVIFFNKNWNYLLRPEIWRLRGCHDLSGLAFVLIWNFWSNRLLFSPESVRTHVANENFSKQNGKEISFKNISLIWNIEVFHSEENVFWRRISFVQSSRFSECQNCQLSSSITEIVRNQKYVQFYLKIRQS